jgi:hypothetical protein
MSSILLFQLFPFIEGFLHPPLLLHCFDSCTLSDMYVCVSVLIALWSFPLVHTTELDRPLSHRPSFGVSVPRHQRQIWSLPHFLFLRREFFSLADVFYF